MTGVVILVLLICLLFFLRRRKRRGAHVRVLGGGAPGSRLVRSWTRRGILADEIVSPYPVARSESSTPSSSAAKISQTSQVRGATRVSQQMHESSAPSASTSTITTVGASSLSHPSRSTDGHIHSRLVVNDSPNKNDLPALRSQVAALHKKIERLQDQRR